MLRAALILCLLCSWITGAEPALPVPDPYGLGERLALIDWLQEQGQTIAPDTSLDDLRQRYQTLVLAPPARSPSAIARADQARRLRADLELRYQLDLAPDLDLKALLQIQANQRAADHAAAQALLAADQTHQTNQTEPPSQSPSSPTEPLPKTTLRAPTRHRYYRYTPQLTDRIDRIPDLYQASAKLGHQGGGYFHCVPTAVSNYLMWLAQNGYEQLCEGHPQQARAHWEVARTLAGADYMNTHPGAGTYLPDTLRGLRRYINERGYQIESLVVQGLRDIPGFTVQAEAPSLAFLKAGLQDRGAVWLSIGYYSLDDQQRLRRLAGHLITLVGYGQARNGSTAPDTLTINDSADGARRHRCTITTEALPETASFTLAGQDWPAGGHLRIISGYRSCPEGLLPVIDATIALRLR